MSEIKHPLKHVKLKKNAAEAEINSTKQVGNESFCMRIADCFKGKDNYCMIKDKKLTKCEYYKLLINDSSLGTVAEFASELVTSSQDVRNKCIKGIIGGGHAAQRS